MELEYGMRVHIYQVEKMNPGDRMRLSMFDLKYRIRSMVQSLKSILTFKIPEYRPYLKMRLPRDDAKRIYRALPVNGQVGISM